MQRHVLTHRPLRLQHVSTSSRSCIILLHARLYSTPVSPQRQQEAGRVVSETPPHGIPAKKTRVELRPAPRPAQTASPLQQASVPPASAPAAQAALRGTQDQLSERDRPRPPSKQLGLLDMAREDFADAERAGILVPPPPGASNFKLLLIRGKELAKFYFRGAKLIVTNAMDARRAKRRAESGGPPLSRTELQLVRSSRGDLLRLGPFLAIAIVVEEIVPLLILYAPGMLPRTVLLPTQQTRIQEKTSDKQTKVWEAGHAALMSIFAATPSAPLSLDRLGSAELSTLCGLFSLSRFGPDALRRRRLQSHSEYLAQDDKLLRDEKLLPTLSYEVLRTAALERGLSFAGLSHNELQRRLEKWVAATTTAAGGVLSEQAIQQMQR